MRMVKVGKGGEEMSEVREEIEEERREVEMKIGEA